MKKELPSHGISLWRHFLNRERTVDELTGSMIEWQESWNWDFLKINPPACYHALVWGAEYEFFSNPLKEPKLIKPVIESFADVDAIRTADVHSGILGEQLQVIRNLRNHFGPSIPLLETVFSPIEAAHRLMTGREALWQMIQQNPLSVHRLLKTITSTFIHFCEESLKAGADGIFFATKWATSDRMTWAQYEEFGKQYEVQILDSLKRQNALVILHVCGDRTYLRNMLDYNVDVFSYDFYADGAVDPAYVQDQMGKQVLGGIDPKRLEADPEGAAEQCRKYLQLDRWIAGPSCVVPPTVSADSIRLFLARFESMRI